MFFRRVQVSGLERIPSDVPLVYVVNHYNSLVDPIVILGKLPRFPRFIATASLWKKPAFRPFLAFGRVIPVYRQSDAPAGERNNLATFAACHKILWGGGSLTVFPEGRSHDEPELQPMKTGVARIILGAARQRRGLRIRVVPVGLTYDAKLNFRSRVLVHVGEPFDPLSGIEQPDAEDRPLVRGLTDRIGAALDAVTLSYPSWEEARLIDRAAELFARGRADTPGEHTMADDFPIRKAFAEGYRQMKSRHPERVAAVAASVQAYDRMLAIYSLRHEHIVSRYPTAVVLVYLFRTVFLLLVRLPIAIVGLAMNAATYLIAWASGYVGGGTPEERATRRILAGVFASAFTWAGWAILAGITGGALWGWAALALGPLGALTALHFLEQRRQLFEEARAYLRLRSRDNIRRELGERRDDVYRQVADLANQYMNVGGDADT